MRKKLFIKATRREVERFREETKDKDEYRRASAILLKAERKTYKEIAKTVGVIRNTAIVWVRNFRKKGIEALKTHKPGGQIPTLTMKEKKIVVKTALSKPNFFGHLKSEWSLRFLSRHLSKETGIKVSKSHIHRILTESGIKFKRPKATINNRNPAYYRKKKEIESYKKIAPALKKKSVDWLSG